MSSSCKNYDICYTYKNIRLIRITYICRHANEFRSSNLNSRKQQYQADTTFQCIHPTLQNSKPLLDLQTVLIPSPHQHSNSLIQIRNFGGVLCWIISFSTFEFLEHFTTSIVYSIIYSYFLRLFVCTYTSVIATLRVHDESLGVGDRLTVADMNCGVKNGGYREGEGEKSGRRSVEGVSSQNGSPVAPTDLSIDERVLIDAKSLFIGSKIGEGAHGKVYKGRYGDRIVAIKVLNCGNTLEERAVLENRFVREVTMMSKVKHENLVKFIGACKDPIMVIVTELLPEMSLRKYLSSIRPNQLELHVALSFALDIAQAMDCLHANGIIHRDLKPDNLLLTENQKSVKLADFGLAREESLTEMMTAETGTYRWMAPELYSTVTLRQGEKKHYNNKVDVYSFGIVLWELLTNRMPFEGMSNLQAAYAAAFKQARPTLPEDTPPDLAFIIHSCWVEDPNVRPSFSQIIRMINEFLFTLEPSSPSLPESDSSEAEFTGNGAIIEFSPPAKGKFSFIRQLFAMKKARSSQ